MNSDINFEKTYIKYFKVLNLFALRIVENPDAAEDIVQDVFMDCWARWNSLDFSCSIKPYLYKLTYNRCLDYLKRSDKKNIRMSTISSLADELFITTFTLDEQLHYKEIGKEIEYCVSQLPEKCQEVFLLSRRDNLKNKEISEKLNISVKTVEKHISKALGELRNYFKNKGLLAFFFFFV